jgi:hypothetical protein
MQGGSHPVVGPRMSSGYRNLTVEEAASAAGLPVHTPAREVVRYFLESRSVWEGLYGWVEALGYIDTRLHSRVMVGDRLMRQLSMLEKRRLRAKYPGLTREELEHMFGWSYGGSSPMESFPDCDRQDVCPCGYLHDSYVHKLVGDGLFVLPD